MEFYLVDDLECDLIVFHPYRTLLALCRKEVSDSGSLFGSEEGEAEEVGTGLGAEDGPRYWGSKEGQLELAEGAVQTAWYVHILSSSSHSYLQLGLLSMTRTAPTSAYYILHISSLLQPSILP
jgi:hypothetical protein